MLKSTYETVWPDEIGNGHLKNLVCQTMKIDMTTFLGDNVSHFPKNKLYCLNMWNLSSNARQHMSKLQSFSDHTRIELETLETLGQYPNHWLNRMEYVLLF